MTYNEAIEYLNTDMFDGEKPYAAHPNWSTYVEAIETKVRHEIEE